VLLPAIVGMDELNRAGMQQQARGAAARCAPCVQGVTKDTVSQSLHVYA